MPLLSVKAQWLLKPSEKFSEAGVRMFSVEYPRLWDSFPKLIRMSLIIFRVWYQNDLSAETFSQQRSDRGSTVPSPGLPPPPKKISRPCKWWRVGSFINWMQDFILYWHIDNLVMDASVICLCSMPLGTPLQRGDEISADPTVLLEWHITGKKAKKRI